MNVLIALLDENHTNHATVSDWFAENIALGWASCPITQNGFVRIVSQSSYPHRLGIAEAVRRLNAAISTRYHRFVADDISLFAGAFVSDWQTMSSARLTDTYLLALAVTHGFRFVSLDRRMQLASVRNADARHIVML